MRGCLWPLLPLVGWKWCCWRPGSMGLYAQALLVWAPGVMCCLLVSCHAQLLGMARKAVWAEWERWAPSICLLCCHSGETQEDLEWEKVKEKRRVREGWGEELERVWRGDLTLRNRKSLKALLTLSHMTCGSWNPTRAIKGMKKGQTHAKGG